MGKNASCCPAADMIVNASVLIASLPPEEINIHHGINMMPVLIVAINRKSTRNTFKRITERVIASRTGVRGALRFYFKAFGCCRAGFLWTTDAYAAWKLPVFLRTAGRRVAG